MVKFVVIFLTALCLTHNLQKTLAEKNDFFGILELQKMLEEKEIIEMQKVLTDEVVRQLELLGKAVEETNYKKKVSKDIKSNEISLKRIFKMTKEEMKELSNDSSFSKECSDLVYEELAALEEKTKTDVANCIARGDKKTSEIIDDVKKKLMEESKYLIEVFIVKSMKCIQKLKGDDIADISQCFDMVEGMQIRKDLEAATYSAMDVSKVVLQQVAEDVGKCLTDVKIDTQINTEHVTDEMKSCFNQV